ncbi:hypothetical protein [Oceanispirochaeta sp.]|jgi:hypothetical protein|uniref:hypothetical protein n=1 Tax=Oceanispirochaeta sp. TaxID=2035350 RepID=UPI00261219A6|nr:hypothetical protein [Oceanispirochaeta sp.]MDA3955243.1 hypothetical protein [Oceanispirochaeta sp.]
MELKANKIPDEFRMIVPRGMRLVKRQEEDFLLVESVYCPKGHNLMVDSVRIHGEPSIKLEISFGGQKGLIFVDAFWGSHAKLFSFLPECGEGDHLEGFCPYCHVPLREEYSCHIEGCDSKSALVLHLPSSTGKVYVCDSLGCPGHFLDVNSLPHEMTESISGINFFGHGSEDLFGGLE